MFGLQSKSSESLSDEIIELLSAHFGEKVGSFSVYNMMDTPHIEFNITFDLYNFFIITFTYDRGRFGCNISQGKYGLSLENSQKSYDKADMNIFLRELEQQVKLRIPDKYLAYYGWD